jgi:hypothetical protein
MTLLQAHEALQHLMRGGAFVFDHNLATVTMEQYIQFVDALEPQDYEVAFQYRDYNIIEKQHVDRENNRVAQLRRERTWEEQNMRAFELEITEVPELILVTPDSKINEPKILTTTWWLMGGTTVHYVQLYNGAVLEDIGILNDDE